MRNIITVLLLTIVVAGTNAQGRRMEVVDRFDYLDSIMVKDTLFEMMATDTIILKLIYEEYGGLYQVDVRGRDGFYCTDLFDNYFMWNINYRPDAIIRGEYTNEGAFVFFDEDRHFTDNVTIWEPNENENAN